MWVDGQVFQPNLWIWLFHPKNVDKTLLLYLLTLYFLILASTFRFWLSGFIFSRETRSSCDSILQETLLFAFPWLPAFAVARVVYLFWSVGKTSFWNNITWYFCRGQPEVFRHKKQFLSWWFGGCWWSKWWAYFAFELLIVRW